MAQDTVNGFWETAKCVHNMMTELERALIDAQLPYDSAREVMFPAQEKVKLVYDLIHERLSGLDKRSNFAQKYGYNPVEIRLEAAKDLMVLLLNAWQEAEVDLSSVKEGSVIEAWENASASMELLNQKLRAITTD